MQFRLNELREIVRGILAEREETLKRWGEKSEDPVDVALTKIGILPVPQGKWSSSTVGEGTTNSVKEVVYQGRRCVARYSSEITELNALLRFVDFQRFLDPKYAKHFPEVIRSFEVQVGGKRIYGALVELLEPMPPGLVRSLDDVGATENLPSGRVDLFLEDDKIRVDIVRFLETRGKKSRKEAEEIFDDIIVPELVKFSGWSNDPTQLATDLGSALASLGSIGTWLTNVVLGALKKAVIPHSKSGTGFAGRYPSSKVKEFMEFLHALEEAGMGWEDLHTGNFMVRRSTGDFVVADPGLFL